MTTVALPPYVLPDVRATAFLSAVSHRRLMIALLRSEHQRLGWVDGDITTPTYAFIRVIDWRPL